MDEAGTPPRLPIMAPSNEATKPQLADARAEGDSINRCIQWILANTGTASGSVRAGEYRIIYAVTPPEGWYTFSNNTVSWQNAPDNVNAHLYLFVLDGADGRVVPMLNIHATVLNQLGNVVDNQAIPYAWMPMVNGYGNNIKLSGSGKYVLQLQILPPHFHRHDPYNGDRFSTVVNAIIPVTIDTAAIIRAKTFSQAMEQQTSLSMLQGQAYSHTLKDMYKQANFGKDTTLGDYFIALAVEYAEGWWAFDGDKFRYKVENEESGKTNAHIEVAVCDAKTKRFLHDLDVTATLYDDAGNIVGTMDEPFMWHPWLYHYGQNWRVPHAGKNYRVHVHFQPPSYRRYGKEYGNTFTLPADIDFYQVTIKTGQK